VHIHEELSLDILGRKTSEVDLIEDDAGRLVDAEQANEQGDDCQTSKESPFSCAQLRNIIVFYSCRGIVLALLSRKLYLGDVSLC